MTARRFTKNEISASVSSKENKKEEEVTILGKSDAGPILDEDAVKSYRTRFNEIEMLISEAKSNNDIGKIEKLEGEKEWMLSELSNASGFGGKIRNLADDRNKVRIRVSNAIRRALKRIEQYDKPLSEHLQKPILNLGHTLGYVPRDGLNWSSVPNPKN